jgi:hypothetical protein
MSPIAINAIIQVGEALIGGLIAGVPVLVQTHNWTAALTAFATGAGLKWVSPQIFGKQDAGSNA